MNTRALAAGAVTTAALMALASCASDEHTYEIEGRVESKYVECEGDGEAAMDNAAFSRTSGGGGRGGSSGGGRGGSSGGRGGSGAKSGSGKGPSLSKQPSKPVKIPGGKIPAPILVPPSGRDCEQEYELFIKNSDGLFEQDVASREHYDACEEGEEFPSCAGG